jgi:hypothetical protein
MRITYTQKLRYTGATVSDAVNHDAGRMEHSAFQE